MTTGRITDVWPYIDTIRQRDVLDHRIAMANAVLSGRMDPMLAKYGSSAKGIDPRIHRGNALLPLSQGVVWWVSPELCELVDHAARSMPPHTLAGSDPPFPHGVVLFGVGLKSTDTDHADEAMSISAMTWSCGVQVDSAVYEGVRQPGSAVLAIKDWALFGQLGWVPVGGARWPVGTASDVPLRPDETQLELDSGIEDRHRIATVWALASQRRLTTDLPAVFDRAARRRSERSELPEPRAVRLIDLRHHAQRSAPGEGNAVDWSHRWIVNGHWREQPYGPDRSRRRPTWIAPYVKGPDDKPLVIKENVGVLR